MTVETARANVLANLDRLKRIFADKSARYGDAWYDNGSEDAVPYMWCEVNAKYKRLHKMAWKDRCQDKPACAETYLDMALYATMSAAVLIDNMSKEELELLEAKLRA